MTFELLMLLLWTLSLAKATDEMKAVASLIEHTSIKTWTHLCSSLVIGKSTALAPAHCLDNKDLNRIKLIMNHHSDGSLPQSTHLKRVQFHPNWYAYDEDINVKIEGDLAVIHLADDISGDSYQFSNISANPLEVLPYFTNCSLYGRPFGNQWVSGPPLNASVDLIADDVCHAIYDDWSIKGEKLCVQLSAEQECIPDKGALLICQDLFDATKSQVVGMSITDYCGLIGLPAIFVNLQHYKNWILENLK